MHLHASFEGELNLCTHLSFPHMINRHVTSGPVSSLAGSLSVITALVQRDVIKRSALDDVSHTSICSKSHTHTVSSSSAYTDIVGVEFGTQANLSYAKR